MEIIVLGILLIFLIFFYAFESIWLLKTKAKIKIRIAVTGSRGKSTTVRFLCALFRNSGYSVLGKITGTKPMLIFPNGKTEIIKRKGIVSILEQKKVLLKKAKTIKPKILISEIMSVTPEYQNVESKMIISPHYYIITNVKNDHIGITGENKQEICKTFLKSAPKYSKVLALKEEQPLFDSIGYSLHNVSFITDNTHLVTSLNREKKIQPGFEQTLLFAKAMCHEFGICDDILYQTIDEYEFDEEVFFIKQLNSNTIFVNAFSANDVDSTRVIYKEIEKNYPNHQKNAIFCTRNDKPERTKTWIKALQNEKWAFDLLYVFGPHFIPIKRKKYPFQLKKIEESEFPILIKNNKKTLLFGFGNYIQSGQKIVDFWNNTEKLS